MGLIESDDEQLERLSEPQIDLIWNLIDQGLAERKLEVEYERFVRSVKSFLQDTGYYWDDPTQMFLTSWINNISEWAATVFKVYEEVWIIQGKHKTPTFIRAIGHRAIPQWVGIYLDRLHVIIDENGEQRLHPYADADADKCKRQWLNKCEIDAQTLEYQRPMPAEANLADTSPSAEGADTKISTVENSTPATQQSNRFNPDQFGGKEVCIAVSYAKDGQRDMAKLSRILTNKAQIQYDHGSHHNPKTWFQKDPPGFTNHIYRLRKKAARKDWTHHIPADYWKSYNS